MADLHNVGVKDFNKIMVCTVSCLSSLMDEFKLATKSM